jgi:hypothetical protein
MNVTLLLNVAAIVSAGASVALVSAYALTALALAFAAGVAVTISSRYAFAVARKGSESA